MTSPDMTPLQWRDIRHITDFHELLEDDYACLEDVRRVLAQHQRLNKFGVALLHRHFKIGDNEIFVETVDPETRTLIAKATPRSEVKFEGTVETLWRFGPHVGDVHAAMECKTSLTHDKSDPDRPPPSPLPGPTEPTTPTRPNPSR